MAKQIINVYRGIETGKLFLDEFVLRLRQTKRGTKLFDRESGEEVVLDQESSGSGLLQKV